MKIKLMPHAASNGCRLLATTLSELGHNVKRLKISGSSYTGNNSHLIINWGKNDRGNLRSGISVLNEPERVRLASDKVSFFKLVTEAGFENLLPKWTTTQAQAKRFIQDEGLTVYCRTLSNASQGRGIIIATSASQIEAARLFTCKVESAREIRVHVFGGNVIDFAQKKRMSSERRETEGIEEVSDEVRSHSNGWIYAREGITIPTVAKEAALKVIELSDLHFGAVDIIITPQGVPKVLEINTAPGLEGTTITKYAEAIQALTEES